MTREEAINILIAVAVCSTEYLYCDEHCPFYHPEGVRICNEWNDEMAKEAVETISALRQQDVANKDAGKNEPLTNAQKIRSMTDEELAKLLCCTGWRMIEQKECLEWLQQPAEENDHDERKENEHV